MKEKKFISLMLSLAMFPSTGVFTLPTASAATSPTVICLDPSDASPFNNGEFQGWGTSMGWWGNRIGYSDTLAQKAAEIFYSEEGLGLDIVRYNVGGGDDPTHNHVTRSDSKLPCFAVPQYNDDGTLKTDSNGDVIYDYNWDADFNQVNVLKRIKNENPDVHIEGYTNSPPWFMTVSQCSGGGVDSSENLDVENYDVFSSFLADVTEHFEEDGLKFDSYSPMNEPSTQTKYWGALSPKQEGNHVAPGEHQSGLIVALDKEYSNRGIDTLIAGPDETSIDYSISSFNALSAEAKAALDRLDTHTYGGSKRAELKQTAIDGNKTLWMSEVDGGWNGFGLADRIISDMNGMQPAAWIMWDIVDFHKDSSFQDPSGNYTEANNSLDPTATLWGVAMADHDNQSIELSNKYYAYGQFTKYINPGDTIIASSNSTLAAYDKTTGDIKIVATNSSSSDKSCIFDLTPFTNIGSSIKEIRSNNLTGDLAEHWAVIDGEATLSNKKITTTLKAGTVTTYIVEGNGATDYAVISGGKNELSLGDSVTLSVKTNIANSGVTWSVSDPTKATLTSDGTITAIASGTVTVYAQVGNFTVSRDFTIPMYKLTGTASWGNSSTMPQDSADYTQAADGDLSTFFDGTTGGYVMYDYGTPFRLTSLKLAARSGGYTDRTVGGTVQASNDAITWTDLYKITSAIPADTYTEISADKLLSNKAYRYFRYTNNDNMANIAEFLLEGTPSWDIPEDAPTVNDIDEFTDNFESDENIFGAEAGTLSSDGNQIFASGLERFSNVFVPVKGTAEAQLSGSITLTEKDRFRLCFNMFAGWENNGKDNTFILKDANGNELVALYLTGGGYNLNQLRISGTNVLSSTPIAQCRSNPGTSKAGANGWNNSSQPYRNTVGYNKTAEIIIDGTDTISVAFTGGMEDTVYTGTIATPVSIKSISVSGSYNSARDRVVSYDNFDADLITYSTALENPEAPEPTEPPILPENGELISLDFNNGDLTSGSAYGKVEGSPKFVTEDNKACIQLDGTSATSIKLTDINGNSLLSGIDEMTVSFKVKPTSTAASWILYAAPDNNAQTYLQEKYFGIRTQSETVRTERYNNGGTRSAEIFGTLIQNAWNDIIVSVSSDSTDVYVNGVLADSQQSSVDLSDMLGTSSVAYIGLANWGSGEYATGFIDDFVIYSGALPPNVWETFTAYAKNNSIKFTSDYSADTGYDMYVALYNTNGKLKAIKINTGEGSFDNLENGTYKVSCFSWSDKMEALHTKTTKTVKIQEDIEMGAYLFAHFVGTESSENEEQVYFSVSADGITWTTLNSGNPVLKSTVGELGVRDPYVLRGEDGKFFVIATDLSIYNRRDDSNRWSTCQTSGSKSIVIWESSDLVNWSEARLIQVANDNAGCAWAPEAVYDVEKDAYMVFWASKTADDSYATQRIYRSYTKDFVTFTKPEVYIDGGTISNIDTTITSHNGVYYRFTKNESKSSVTMMKSTSLSGKWRSVSTYTLGEMTGYEGPTIYKLNGEDKWCLLLDYYSKSQGYKPFVTDNITTGNFISASDFSFDAKYRHGTVMPITTEEYTRLVEAYK